jgi:hypothetical protein
MNDSDLWRLAAILLQKYGEEAEMYARLKADEALEKSNNRSCIVWKRVALAVSDLEQHGALNRGLH